jgi:hypothetical protein
MADGTHAFNKISSIHSNPPTVANLSATGKGCQMQVDCNDIGTTLFLSEGSKTSTFCISKGDLASVSYFLEKFPWILFVGLAFIGVDLYFQTLVLAGIGIVVMIFYFFASRSVMEFESSGGRTVSFHFSGGAAKRSEELGSFCKSAIMIDKSIHAPEPLVHSGKFPEPNAEDTDPFGYQTTQPENTSSVSEQAQIPPGWTKEQWEYYGKKPGE